MKRLWSLWCCLCVVSCEGSRPRELPTNPTSGQVLVNGSPAAGVRIEFHPVNQNPEQPIYPAATTKDDGRFTLETYKQGDGAPAGDYLVTLTWPAYHSKRDGYGPDK